MTLRSKQIVTLKRWLNSRGWKVRPGKIDATNFDSKLITLSRRVRSPKCKLFILMHECGHVLIGTTVRDEDETVVSPLHIRCQVFIEECLAWHHGMAIMRSLGCEIDEKEYFSYAAKFLKQYSDVTFGAVVKNI